VVRPPDLLQCTLVAIGPSRHFAAVQQSVAFEGKADIRCRFFEAVAARIFDIVKGVCRTHTPPLQPVLLSAMSHRTAHSCTKYDERYYR
jgi:hypothetical protein